VERRTQGDTVNLGERKMSNTVKKMTKSKRGGEKHVNKGTDWKRNLKRGAVTELRQRELYKNLKTRGLGGKNSHYHEKKRRGRERLTKQIKKVAKRGINKGEEKKAGRKDTRESRSWTKSAPGDARRTGTV